MPFSDREEGVEEELAERPALDIDADLLAFLRSRINSFVKWDIVQFFHRNPNTVDTAENIARYVGRSIESMHEEMAELSSTGVLAENKLDGMTIYSLSPKPDVRELLDRFAESCGDQRFKLKAVYHILRSMR